MSFFSWFNQTPGTGKPGVIVIGSNPETIEARIEQIDRSLKLNESDYCDLNPKKTMNKLYRIAMNKYEPKSVRIHVCLRITNYICGPVGNAATTSSVIHALKNNLPTFTANTSLGNIRYATAYFDDCDSSQVGGNGYMITLRDRNMLKKFLATVDLLCNHLDPAGDYADIITRANRIKSQYPILSKFKI